MSAAFTSGPWQFKNDYDGRYTIIGNVDGELHSDGTETHSYDFVANCEDEYGIPAKRENQRLILAAPELYEALDGLLATVGVDSCAYDAERYAKAESALAKARGEA